LRKTRKSRKNYGQRIEYRKNDIKLVSQEDPQTGKCYYTVINIRLPGTEGRSVHRHYTNRAIAFMVAKYAANRSPESMKSLRYKTDVWYLMTGKQKGNTHA
jgi:hypothetical protein